MEVYRKMININILIRDISQITSGKQEKYLKTLIKLRYIFAEIS